MAIYLETVPPSGYFKGVALISVYLPHGFCMNWQGGLIALHVLSDVSIALAYMSIPCLLFYFVRRRRDIQLRWLFLLFGIFIASCGLTHMMDVVTLWLPLYTLAGIIKAVTAVSSVATAVSLARLMPKLLRIPSVGQLEEANDRLRAEFVERSRAEEALRSANDLFRTALNLSHVAVWNWNVAADRTEWYGPCEQLYGVPASRLTSYVEFKKFIHPEDRPLVQERVTESVTTGKDFECEFRSTWPDGAIRWLAGYGGVVHETGKVVKISGINFDITSRKLVEKALKQSEEHFRSLANAMPQIVWTADAQGNIEYANDRWYAFAGELQGSGAEPIPSLEPLMHPEDVKQFRETRDEGLATGKSYRVEFRLWDRASAEYRWFLCHASVAKEEQGAAVRWFGTFTDVQSLKVAESNLRERERQLALLFQVQSMAEWGWEIEQNTLSASAVFWELYGEMQPLTSANAEWCRRRWHPEDIPAIEKATRLALERDVPLDIEFRVIWPRDQSVHWLACRGIVIRDGAGKPVRTSGVAIDVTEHKKQEERFRAVVEATPSAMILVAADGTIAFANSQAEKLFGYTRAELFGQPATLLWVEAAVAAAPLQAVAQRRDPRGRKKDGSTMPIEVGLTPVNLQEGDFTLVSVLDVTEQRKANETSQLFRTLVSSVKDYAIYMLSPEGIVLSWNEGAQHIYGYSAEEIIGRSFACFYEPADNSANKPAEKLKIALSEGKFSGEGWRVRRDGTHFVASATVTPIWDLAGRHCGFCSVVHDVTEKKAAEEKLKKSEHELRLLADVIPQVVWMYDAKGVPVYCNRRWYDFSGMNPPPREEDLGTQSLKTFLALLHPLDSVETIRKWSECLATETPFKEEYRMWDRRQGEHRWYLGSAMPVRDESGKVVRWIGTATEIHEQKLAAEKLEAEVQNRTAQLSVSLQQLRASLAEKEILLKEVHHRVKNNLQIISSLLNMQASNVQDADAVAKLRDSERRVMSMALIHEQLYNNKDMSLIDFSAYVARLAPSVMSLSGKTSDVRCSLDLTPLTLTIEQAIPCGLILNELITNALKYAYPNGQKGDVVVRLTQHADWVGMTVSDHGVGMPPDFNLETTKSLGLKIVQVLAKQVQGTFQINLDNGTTFHIRFPMSGSAKGNRTPI